MRRAVPGGTSLQRWATGGGAMALVAGLALGLVVGTPPAPADAALASDELVVIAQDFNVAVDGDVEITVRVPEELSDALDDPSTDVVVTSYRVLADRPAFLSALDGTFPRTEDTFDVDVATEPVDPTVDPAIGPVLDPSVGPAEPPVYTRTGPDTFALRIPTESTERTSSALQISQSGVHPVVIELRAGRQRFEATTFLNRLSADDETVGDLSVGLLLGQTSVPGIDIDGQPRATPAELAELAEMADALAAIDAASINEPAPRTVRIEPSSLGSLGPAQPDVAARLGPLLAASDLVAGPRLPLDPAAAAATPATPAFDPVAVYTRWLREGEDQLDALLPTTAIDRSIHLATDPLTTPAAAMLRNLGVRMMVLPYERFAGIEGSTGLFTDTTQLVSVDLADGTTMPAAVIDPYLAERMDDGAADPLGAAIEIVADLIVMADSIDASGRLVGRHGTILGTSDLGIPDAALLGQLVPLLLSTPGLDLVDPGDIGTTVDTWLIDGRPVTITLPTEAPNDMSARSELIESMSRDIAAFGSMLPANDPLVDGWSAIVDAVPSTAVSDAQAASMAATLERDYAELAAGIEIEASSFTLTGRNSTVRFGVRNLTDQTLTVRVQFNSPKIRFPQGDQQVVVAPQSVSDVVSEAVALSNGTSSVFIRVYTPQGASTEPLVPEVVLTARVTSFAGVAQLITIAAVLLIIAWWARHWQRSRRTRRTAPHRQRHPAAVQGRARSTDTSTEPSPDAAASTLPPS